MPLSRSRTPWVTLPGLDWSGRIIGHCRLSTSGPPADNANNQPLVRGEVALAHNGNVYDHRWLARWYGVALDSGCDSELLAALLDSTPRSLRPWIALGAAGAAPYAVLALRGRTVWAARAGLPLYTERTATGWLIGSVAWAGAELVRDHTCLIFEEDSMDPIVQATPARQHPVSNVRWVDPSTLRSNAYNPNKVFGPEMELLKRSILEDGWTQPIVVREDGEVVDGFHRWTLGSKDPEVRAASGGLVPVVILSGKDTASQMISTVRHNRARGQHGIVSMGSIVRTLREEGLADEEIVERLGMEQEELDRLAETRSSPELAGKDSFGKGWIPSAASEPPARRRKKKG